MPVLGLNFGWETPKRTGEGGCSRRGPSAWKNAERGNCALDSEECVQTCLQLVPGAGIRQGQEPIAEAGRGWITKGPVRRTRLSVSHQSNEKPFKDTAGVWHDQDMIQRLSHCRQMIDARLINGWLTPWLNG